MKRSATQNLQNLDFASFIQATVVAVKRALLGWRETRDPLAASQLLALGIDLSAGDSLQ